MKHTATPWSIEHIGVTNTGPNQQDVFDLRGGNPVQVRIATVAGPDAAFIVQVVNLHERMIRVLQNLSDTEGNWAQVEKEVQEILSLARKEE